MTNHGTKGIGGRLLSAASALSVAVGLAVPLATQGALADDVGQKWQLGNKVTGGGVGGGIDLGGLLPVVFDRGDKTAAITGNDWDAYEHGLITKDELLAEHPEYDKPGFFDKGNGVTVGDDRGGLQLVAFERPAGAGDIGMNRAELIAEHPEFDKPGYFD